MVLASHESPQLCTWGTSWLVPGPRGVGPAGLLTSTSISSSLQRGHLVEVRVISSCRSLVSLHSSRSHSPSRHTEFTCRDSHTAAVLRGNLAKALSQNVTL